MSYKIKQYRPSFVESEEPLQIGEFSSYEELIEIPFVKNHIDSGHSVALEQSNQFLMAAGRDGSFVVGYLYERIDFLPTWERP